MDLEEYNLPNQKSIKRVIESLRLHPDIWHEVGYEFGHLSNEIWTQCRLKFEELNRMPAYADMRPIITYNSTNPKYEGWRSASDALCALIAWDECAYMLDSEISELEILTKFHDARAIMLLPACIAFAKIKELK